MMILRQTTLLLLCALTTVADPGVATSRLVLNGADYLNPALPDCGFQAAIDAAAAAPGGGEVTLPEGDFALRRSLFLRTGVTLRGQGPDRTILRSAFTNRWIKIESCVSNQVTLAFRPDDLRPGATVHLWPRRNPGGWLGYYEPQIVTAVDGRTLTVDGVHLRLPGNKEWLDAWLEYGLCAVLTAPVNAPADALEVADASLFSVGQAVSVGSADGNENQSLSFIRAISNQTLRLERPIRFSHAPADSGFWKRPAVWSLFPLLTCEQAGAFVVRDLALVGAIPPDAYPKMSRYTLSPIHFSFAANALLENLVVSNSLADGYSLQSGSNVTVRHCRAVANRGNGFHPGTGLTDSLFESCTAEGNGAGLYFCWHNKRHRIVGSTFVRNRGGGITGLGNPADRFNLIDTCLLAENGGPGIAINGGPDSGNTIRFCRIENNSRAEPGRWPGIALHAGVEEASGYTIVSNILRDTQAEPTQWVGIEERDGLRQGKTIRADRNVLQGNSCTGHRTADMILAGPDTRAWDNDAAVIVRRGPDNDNKENAP